MEDNAYGHLHNAVKLLHKTDQNTQWPLMNKTETSQYATTTENDNA